MKPIETLFTLPLRLPGMRAVTSRTYLSLWRTMSGAMRRANKKVVRPREWSNMELKRVASLFSGRTLNVSGWKDEDKEGGHYRDYFLNASSYSVSNFSGSRGVADGHSDLFLDLEADFPVDLQHCFDVVFNHTTLEHVYDIQTAVRNICSLSSDAVILVTPFLQSVHFIDDAFGDYWRPTPMCLRRMLKENGFEVVYQVTNDNPWYIVYVMTVAVRNPETYRASFSLPAQDADKVGSVHFYQA